MKAVKDIIFVTWSALDGWLYNDEQAWRWNPILRWINRKTSDYKLFNPANRRNPLPLDRE